jgi:hypothetical protein
MVQESSPNHVRESVLEMSEMSVVLTNVRVLHVVELVLNLTTNLALKICGFPTKNKVTFTYASRCDTTYKYRERRPSFLLTYKAAFNIQHVRNKGKRSIEVTGVVDTEANSPNCKYYFLTLMQC